MKNFEIVFAAIAILFSLNTATASLPRNSDDIGRRSQQLIAELNSNYSDLNLKCHIDLNQPEALNELQALHEYVAGRLNLPDHSLQVLTCKRAACFREDDDEFQP